MNLARSPTPVTYSPGWTFIPTHWCRNTCGYCVFVERTGDAAQLVPPDIARREIERARRAGATELLIMSGEGVEESRAVRNALRRYGFGSYLDYLIDISRAALVADLLPHINVGNVSEAEFDALRAVVPSMGMMLETSDAGLRRETAHRRAPDKEPARRLETLRAAGRARMPFTTGLLVGIGETHAAREATLHDIAAIAREFGHIQEVIVQPFTPHAGTAMAHTPAPRLTELRDTVEMACAILPAGVTVQIPPNIAPRIVELVRAGARDLGGISPDGDRINPAARWLTAQTYASILRPHGYILRPRLAVYEHLVSPRWLSRESLDAVERVRARLPESSSAQVAGAAAGGAAAHV